MGNVIYAPITNQAIAADATCDWFSVIGTSAVKLRLLAFELTSAAIVAAAVKATLHHATSSGTGGTALVEQQADDSITTAILGVARANDFTTQAGDGGMIAGYEWEQLGPLSRTWTPEMAPISAVTNGFAMTAVSAIAMTVSGFICWEEIIVA